MILSMVARASLFINNPAKVPARVLKLVEWVIFKMGVLGSKLPACFLGRARRTGLAQCSLPLLCGLRAIALEQGLLCPPLKDSGCGFACQHKKKKSSEIFYCPRSQLTLLSLFSTSLLTMLPDSSFPFNFYLFIFLVQIALQEGACEIQYVYDNCYLSCSQLRSHRVIQGKQTA